MNKAIIVTGIPGTGKTTVCNAVEKLAKQAGKKVNVINYGSVMVKTLRKRKKEMDRDAMRKTGKQEEAAKGILKALEQI